MASMILLLLLLMMMPLRHCREHLLTNRVGHRRHFDVSVCPLKCIPDGFFTVRRRRVALAVYYSLSTMIL